MTELLPITSRAFANIESFGFVGASGSTAFADPVNNIGYCYIPTLVGDNFPDSRNAKIQEALYECIFRLQKERLL